MPLCYGMWHPFIGLLSSIFRNSIYFHQQGRPRKVSWYVGSSRPSRKRNYLKDGCIIRLWTFVVIYTASYPKRQNIHQYGCEELKYLLNPLKAELNPTRHLLALAGAHHFVDVSKIRLIRSKLCFKLQPDNKVIVFPVSCFVCYRRTSLHTVCT
jgi:hypothetical protein